MVRRLMAIPGPVIILGFFILGTILGFGAGQPYYFTVSRKPTQLEPLPVAAARFQAINADWLSVGLYVEAENDQIYVNGQSYVNEWESYTWKISEPLLEEEGFGEIGFGKPCSKIIEKRIERQAGILSECHTVNASGEYCGVLFASFAIDEQGNVWQAAQPGFCYLGLIVVPVFAVAGAMFGAVLVLLRWLDTKIFGKAGAKP